MTEEAAPRLPGPGSRAGGPHHWLGPAALHLSGPRGPVLARSGMVQRFPGAGCSLAPGGKGQRQGWGAPKPQPLAQPAGRKEPGRSDMAGYPGHWILSGDEEERGTPEDFKQEVLPQLSEARSPDLGAAMLQEAACNKPPHQKRGFKKLVLIADDQKPPTGEKPYRCTECRKCFKGRSRLLNHLQTHMTQKMFVCVECGKSFSRKASLMVHQRIHTGERPYKCKECEKTFSRRSNLTAHSKTHVKKKTFSCATCKKSFCGRAALFQHQRDHVDEKPYMCTECGNSFLLCSDFINHQQIHLRETTNEHTADANQSEFTSEFTEQMCGVEKLETDHFNFVVEELKKMRENLDMLLLNQQSQLQVLQEIQKQLNILLPGNDLINSNVYSLGLLLGRQAAAAASLAFPLLHPSSLLPENVHLIARSPTPGILPATQRPVSQNPAASTA